MIAVKDKKKYTAEGEGKRERLRKLRHVKMYVTLAQMMQGEALSVTHTVQAQKHSGTEVQIMFTVMFTNSVYVCMHAHECVCICVVIPCHHLFSIG